ncbi:guanine nucleotide exchange factor in transport amine-terminal protein [Toxoplasma gondii TgCatPRC2]|uniref:Guanine nucleotide exchange factor in transport amine-terminal protein n=1 Tax=Toxoplasma gondii TgCatPRC2 TaxID=1130821 RepID=A0A151HAG0_TOXGO|nr:guanine nucleotide exchange factor in transport amine-terminal protein [Toxoplasma gondii TgCatPRC2]
MESCEPGDLGEPPGLSDDSLKESTTSQLTSGSTSHDRQTRGADFSQQEQPASPSPSDHSQRGDTRNPFSSAMETERTSSCDIHAHADQDDPRDATAPGPQVHQSGSNAGAMSIHSQPVSPFTDAQERRLQLHARYQRHQARVVAASRAVEGELLTLCGESKKKAPHLKEATERALLHIQDFRDKAEASIETLSRAACSATSFSEEAAAAEAAEAVFRSFPVKEVLLAASHAVRTHSSKISMLALSLLQRLLTSHQRQLLLLPCAPEDSLLLPQPTARREDSEQDPDDGSASAHAEPPCADAADSRDSSLCFSFESDLPSEVQRHRDRTEAELAATAASDVLLLLAVLEELLLLHQGDDENFVQLKVLQTALLLLAPDSAVAADASVAHRLLQLFFSLYRRTTGAVPSDVSAVSAPGDVRLFAGQAAFPAPGPAGNGVHSSAAVSHTACAAMTQLAACLVDAAGRALNSQRSRERRRERRAMGATDRDAERSDFEATGLRALIVSAADALQTAPWTLPLEELLEPIRVAASDDGLHAPFGAQASSSQSDSGCNSPEDGREIQQSHSAPEREGSRTHWRQESGGEAQTPESSEEAPGPVATLEQLLRQLCANCRGVSSGALSEKSGGSSSSLSLEKEAEREVDDERAAAAKRSVSSAASRGSQPAAPSRDAVLGRGSTSSWSPFPRPSFSFFSQGRGGSGLAREAEKERKAEDPRRALQPLRTDLLLLHLPRGVAVHLLENCMRRGGSLFVQHRGLLRLLKQEVCPALLELFLHQSYDFVTLVRALRVFLFVARQFGSFVLEELQTLLPAILRRTEPDAPLWQRVVALEAVKELCAWPALLRLLHTGGQDLLSEICHGKKRTSSPACAASSKEGNIECRECREVSDSGQCGECGDPQAAQAAPPDEKGSEEGSVVTAVVEALGKTVHQLCFQGSFDSQARLLSTLDLVQPPCVSPLILPVLLPADAVLLLLAAVPDAVESSLASQPPLRSSHSDSAFSSRWSPPSSSLSVSQEGALLLASSNCFDMSAGRFDVAPSPLSGAACAAAVSAWSALWRGDENCLQVSPDGPSRDEKPRRRERSFRWEFRTASKKQRGGNLRLLDKAADLANMDAPGKGQSASFSQQLHASLAVGLALDGLLSVVESLCLLSFSPDGRTTLDAAGKSQSSWSTHAKSLGADEEVTRGEDKGTKGSGESCGSEDLDARHSEGVETWSEAFLLPQQQYLPLPLTRHQERSFRLFLCASWVPLYLSSLGFMSVVDERIRESPNEGLSVTLLFYPQLTVGRTMQCENGPDAEPNGDMSIDPRPRVGADSLGSDFDLRRALHCSEL